HAVYEEVDPASKSPDIYYVSSTDGGKTWSKPADISSSPGVSSDPAVDVGKDGSVVAGWCDTSGADASPDVHFARSADGGKTWGKPSNISSTPGASTEPDVDISPDGTIHVIWLDASPGNPSPDVWATASHDQGKTWDKAMNISDTPGKSMTPA